MTFSRSTILTGLGERLLTPNKTKPAFNYPHTLIESPPSLTHPLTFIGFILCTKKPYSEVRKKDGSWLRASGQVNLTDMCATSGQKLSGDTWRPKYTQYYTLKVHFILCNSECVTRFFTYIFQVPNPSGLWASDKQDKIFSNSFLISPSYSKF